jgi:hypothetical protein
MLDLFDTDGTTKLAESHLSGGSCQRIDYMLPTAASYYVKLYSGGNDYILTVTY